MRRKPDLSPFAIRKAVITTFVFGSGRCRGSGPERSCRNPVGMCRQARGTASAGRAAKIPLFFLLLRKTLRERTADAGRNDDAMRLGPARALKERFSQPQRRILHGGRPYMAWNGHGVQPASSVLTFTAGVRACFHLSDLLT